MIKPDEIKVIEEIFSKLSLLAEKDTYMGDYIKKYVAKDDLDRMISNIRSDFPIELGTYLDKTTGKLKRILNLARRINKGLREDKRDLEYCIKSQAISLQDMANNLNTIHTHDDIVLSELLRLSVTNLTGEIEEVIYTNWNHDVIINAKIDDNIKLNAKDSKRIKFLLELQK